MKEHPTEVRHEWAEIEHPEEVYAPADAEGQIGALELLRPQRKSTLDHVEWH